MKDSNRIPVTLRFSKRDLMLAEQLLMAMGLSGDIKKDFKIIIINVMKHALDSIKKQQAEQEASSAEGNPTVDMVSSQVSGSSDSGVSPGEESVLDSDSGDK